LAFFSKFRQTEIRTEGLKRYLLYAAGEIVLVVLGILIAVQINDWETSRATRSRELKYLKAIRQDLNVDLKRLSELNSFRKQKIASNTKILEHFEGKEKLDLDKLSKIVVQSAMEEIFVPNNNTYKEMLSSGNMNLIKSDTIRLLLLELETLYKTNQFFIDHETFDYREYISKPIFGLISMKKLFQVYSGQSVSARSGIEYKDFEKLKQSESYRNGLYVTTFTSEGALGMYKDITDRSNLLIRKIDEEIK
jgi:Family of unknown function (DUF6090)